MSSSRFILQYYKPLSGLAGRLLTRANTMYPEDPFVILNLASWLISQGKTDFALEAIEKGITIQPDFVPLLDLAGKVYNANMMVEKKIMTYKKILELYPGHPQWFNYENKLNQYERKQTQPGNDGKNLS